MNVTGTVVAEDLGPGVYLLVSEDGRRFTLQGGDAALYRAGQRVEVQGELDPQAMGLAMMGPPVLAVRSFRPAP